MLSFSADVPASIIAGEGGYNSNVIITLNNAVYGDYSYNRAPLIGIPISLGGSAAYGKDYPMTAIGGQSFFVHNHFINASHLNVFGNGSSSGISNEDLAILPISTNAWSGLKDASITPGADLSTCNIYSLDATTSHAKSLYKSLQQQSKWGRGSVQDSRSSARSMASAKPIKSLPAKA
jgi:hypothetical protein